MGTDHLGELRPPVFILGNPRSGTTLLRLMLTCHPSIVVPPECGFAVWLAERFSAWSEADLPRFVSEVTASRKFSTWGIDPARLRDFLEERAPRSYADACSLVYVFYGVTLGRTFRRWGDKNNFYLKHVESILGLYPHARFIHLVRDGRNVAASYLDLANARLDSPFRPQLATDISAIAEEWRRNVKATHADLTRMSAPFIEARFEDLLLAPERELQRLCEFLDEPYDPLMLSYPEQNRRLHLEPVELMAWKQRTLDAPDAGAVHRWSTALTPEQLAVFIEVAGDVLDDYGFR